MPSARRRLALALSASALLALAGPARAAAVSPGLLAAPAALTASIPPRAPGAPSGSELVARLASSSEEVRRRALLEEILRGNVPDFLRRLRPVEMQASPTARAVIWVMPDYLAAGSDEDFVRVPLGLDEALRVAQAFGFTLPTRKMVDSIYRQAERKLAPWPMPAGPAMTSLDFLWRHDRAIAGQLAGSPLGLLVAGDKKDLVMTPRLAARPGKVAIYGWHRPDGRPIQPLSTVHGAAYADYSHGVRLVSETAWIDGQPRSILDLLEDEGLARLLSDEGAIPEARLLLAGPADPRAGWRASLH
jgi:hypothetical protein